MPKPSTPRRFDIYLITLDPTVGTEINKTRPCIIISPDEMNRIVNTVIAAPMTSTIRNYPMRAMVHLKRRQSQVALDQIRTFDKKRLIKKLGTLSDSEAHNIADILVEMFAYQ